MNKSETKTQILKEFGEHFNRSPLSIGLGFFFSFCFLTLCSLPVYWIALAPTPADRAWWKFLIALTICLAAGAYLGRFASVVKSIATAQRQRSHREHQDLKYDSRKYSMEGSNSHREWERDLDQASGTENMFHGIIFAQYVFGGFYTGIRYLVVKFKPQFTPQQLEIAADIVSCLDTETPIETVKVFDVCRQNGASDDAIHTVKDILAQQEILGDSVDGGYLLNPDKPYLQYSHEEWKEKNREEVVS